MTAKRALVIDQNNTFTLQLVRELAAGGHEVTVFAEPVARALRSRDCHVRAPSPPWHAGEEFTERLPTLVDRGASTSSTSAASQSSR